MRRDPLGFLSELARQYGDLVPLRLGRRQAFFINNPDYIEYVLVANLPYTEAVIWEALRLYPPAYAIGRQALGDCEIGGYPCRRVPPSWPASG